MYRVGNIYILGAEDPEMLEIENMLIEHDRHVERACVDGKRVNPRTAYTLKLEDIPSNAVLVECGAGLPHSGTHPYIDHHHPAHLSTKLPPELSVEASSLGQLAKILGVELTPRQRCIAACDHNLTAVYANLVPGVTKLDALPLRAESISKHPTNTVGFTASMVLDMIGIAAKEIAAIEPLANGVRVMKAVTPDMPSVVHLCTIEAAASNMMPVIMTGIEEGSELKTTLSCATADQVRWFMDVYAPANDLGDLYGVPERGFAGGYARCSSTAM